jgi:hypothetical protein
MTSVPGPEPFSILDIYPGLGNFRNDIALEVLFRNDSGTDEGESSSVSRRTTTLAWGLCALGIVGMLAGVALQEALDHANEGGWVEHVGLLIAFASFPVIGALIASRQPRNALGWIFVFIGVSIGLLLVGTEYAFLAFVKEPNATWPGATFGAWLGQWLWFPSLMLIPSLGLLLFPNGKPPSKKWRWLVWGCGIIIAIACAASAFQQRLSIETTETGVTKSIDNPFGLLPIDDGEAAVDPFFFLFFGFTILCVASVIVRYRRAQTEERQQLKLLLLAASLFVITIILGDTFDLPEILFPLTLWTIPCAIGVAILKYRLYDVDAVINKTLVYGVLSGLLGLIYLGIVVVLQQALDPVTQQSDLAIAGSTLAVAALFGPLRSRVQAFIDRRFYRRRYNAAATLSEFTSRLRDEVDLDSLTHELVTVVSSTMQPSHASVWLRRDLIHE